MNLEPLFTPQSVAIVGASNTPGSWGNWLAEQVVRGVDQRRVYFVNPSGDVVYGIRCFKTIQEIPEPVDVAVIAVPIDVFEQTTDQLLVRGAKILVGITTGFAERDNKGFEQQQRIVEKVHKAGSKLIGPNCAGVWDSYSKFHCLPIAEFSPGPVAFISQSGGIITDVYHRLKEVNLGYSRVISTGNQADISIKELVENFDSDPNTKVIALYIENEQTIPYWIFKTLSKPVVLLTPDTSPTARRAAMRHTNSVLSNSFHIEEATVRNGAFYAHTIHDFVATIQVALSNQKVQSSKRTIIVTDSGGVGILAASYAERNNLIVNELSLDLKQKITQEIGRILPQAVINNPIDLISIPGGFTEASVRLLSVLENSHEVDGIIMILFLIETERDPLQDYEVGMQLATIARIGGKPAVFVCKNFSFQGTQALLNEHMSVYRDVETAAKMLEKLCG